MSERNSWIKSLKTIYGLPIRELESHTEKQNPRKITEFHMKKAVPASSCKRNKELTDMSLCDTVLQETNLRVHCDGKIIVTQKQLHFFL